ncbi:CLUMA_CG010648, isoform A [Clunio marinus]|uniref:CLUMA_CG010648, isoform A n=1 Tax=Clunio marinus TaxID=568069 RepID=A0A1J1ICH4_9DIPT|nr:CLUMA_CG010648, isoform A [Clunio marinus]
MKLLSFVTLLVLFAVVYGATIKYDRYYEGDEELKRFEIFKDNVRKVEEHNAGESTFKLGINKFSDMNNDEFRKKHLYRGLGLKPRPRQKVSEENKE